MYKRECYSKVLKRLQEPRRFIQVLAGPRQVGKTTLAHQLEADLGMPVYYMSADNAPLGNANTYWLDQQWEIARLKARQAGPQGAVLILDEIQKITHWSDTVKKLWDADTAQGMPLKIMLLGSAALLIQQGLTESLAGRFELIPMTHWSWTECQSAFGWSIEQYLYFGGYPGAALLISEEERWREYVLNALVETSIGRDILMMSRVQKPALLRQLFELGACYSGQILSYQKIVGQIQDAGCVATVVHYLSLLQTAGLVAGLEKFSTEKVRQKASSPKLQVLNTGLMTACGQISFEAAQANHEYWGRVVESAVGAHLCNKTQGSGIEVFYWREGNKEVDFVLKKGDKVVALEVKSTSKKTALPGISLLDERVGLHKKWLVGAQGMPLHEFLAMSPQDLF